MTTLGIEKGFHSINHVYRTAQELWLSPRLLAKIKLPAGKNIDDVNLPSLPTDSDLSFPGQEILMLRYSPGDQWPDDWDVVAAE